jgi:outer membrane protein insertion porin family
VTPVAAQPPPASTDSLTESAPPEESTPARVGVVRVVGNTVTDSARIVRSFEVPTGSRYSEDAVRRGIRKLFALGLFDNVYVDRHPHDDVMDLEIHVQERPRVTKVEFVGNKKKDNSDLQKKLFIHPGETYSPTTTATQVDSLLRYYHDEGFARVAIDAVTDTVTSGGGVQLKFVIREGEKVRIRTITFAGAHAFPAGKLRKAMKTKQKGFFGGGELKDETFAEDQQKLEEFYHNNGYRDAKVTGHELRPGARPRDLTLTMTVEEGRRYRFGTVAFSGNTIAPGPELAKASVIRAGEKYDQSKIEKTQGGVYAEYAEKGYLYLGVEPKEFVRDSELVDLVFQVSEGQPSNIRYVNISGNKTTREKVLRREVDFFEGDRFKRSALVRTQGDLTRLGLFEEVIPDFAPAESTDVDINIRVKEKQVGTASAGAGYSGDAGLTGFLELGHNNVLGNGQALSLHLERGSKRSDYFLSFTEPWFRDTPTLLGFSAFNTSTDRDLYREERRGGSAKIGRPLAWPDYSRGAVSYQLEDVKITSFGSVLTPQDSIALSGIAIGRPVRTSSLNLDFARNSADNPFYPTKGSRLTLNDELAGGAFGGAVNFNKHRLEGRIYLPSALKGVTTMVRARFGVLGKYTGQHFDVPTYERFRLGGGSTTDPLRGYEDYQVVPGKFIRQVAVDYRSDTTIVAGDTTITHVPTRFEKVRYPGGRFMTLYTVEQQFPIVHPLHGVLFFDAGNTWDLWHEIRPLDLKLGAGIGFRMEIPLLGNIGFDYGYGFDRDDGPRAKGHFLLGNVNF